MDVERLEYLFGPDAVEMIDDYDLNDESDRMQLVDEFLPLPPGAEDRGSRMAVRTVAVTQILTDDPPETWQTVQRLRAAGLDRDAVMAQLAMVIGEQIIRSLESKSRFNPAAYADALDQLPLPSASEIARAAVDVVRAQQGISLDVQADRIAASLSSSRTEIVESMVDEVLQYLIEGPLHLLPGDLAVHAPDLVDGRTFTHRFSEAEAELGVITVAFDLGAFARFDRVRLADGTELDQFSADRDHLTWRGPDGWLADFEPGNLLSVTVTVHAPDGGAEAPIDATVHIDVDKSEPELVDDVVRAVRAGYDDEVAEPGLPVSGEDLALWLCFHRSELFAVPQLPLGELCAAAGLERRAGLVAHDEAVWRRDLFRRRFGEVTALVPDPHWQHVLGRAVGVLDDPDASVDDVREVLGECAEPEALDALADVLFPHYLDLADELEMGGADAPGRLFELVGRATAVARRPRETATAEYLACVLYERSGAPEIAEQHLIRAADAQSRLGPVVERMGWYRFDRGDARGAMRWWRELSEPPSAAATIEPFLAPVAGHKLGRNEPCWCGSGRKFKQCHQNSTELPALPDRVAWLCRKASVWLEHVAGDSRDVVVEMAMARATGDPDADPSSFEALGGDDLAELFDDAFADPIVFDTALHEGRLFQLFLRERGDLLPDDEQLLAASWLTVDRSVHEVVAVEPGATMALRNLATGDVVDVRERTASGDAQVGERYCARVVPDGVSYQIIGGVFPVRAGRESAVLDLCADRDGVALCAWVGGLHQPPPVVHTPGLIDSIIDRDELDAAIAGLGDNADEATVTGALGAELARQTQAAWLDEHVPALGGLTPREAAADPTRREQLERLIDEFDRTDDRIRAQAGDAPDGFHPIGFDTAEIRRQLGLD